MTYEYFIDLFKYENFPVEYKCYLALKDQELNYIAIPWTPIIASEYQDFPTHRASRDIKNLYLTFLDNLPITQTDNFTVCQHDNYLDLIPQYKKLNIVKVFSPLCAKNDHIEGIEIVPIAFASPSTFTPTPKDIFFSFVGCYTTHELRKRMKQRLNGENIIYRDAYYITPEFYISQQSSNTESEFINVVSRSRFGLCPRGSSPSSVRFWECLKAGTIPILISDNWKLPQWDWENTIVQIPEDEFNKMNYADIENMLREISPERETLMRYNCLKAQQQLGCHNFLKYIQKNI
jgi:hypothetical protein